MDCTICLERYGDPDRLPQVMNCGHTFCETCIKLMANSGGMLNCPTCRQRTTLNEVRVNFALRDQLGLASDDPSPMSTEEAPPVPTLPTPDEVDVAVSLQAQPSQSEVSRLLADPQASGNMVDLMITLKPPEGTKRTPVDICCIVDVSDSMGSVATVQDGTGTKVSHGLALLDIVKHALRTIVGIMEDYDRIAIVSYATVAKIIAELTPMTATGRRTVQRRLQLMQLDGMTNLWGGLDKGIELLSGAYEPGRLQHVMLLTDGVPNVNPPRGILKMLERLRDKDPEGKLPCTISTFGFGYDLDSQLLSQIASLGGGSYAFIPDSGFVGTVFVNAVTNLLVTMATDVTITVEPQNGAAFALNRNNSHVLGGHVAGKPNGSLSMNVGTLQFGQSRQVVLRLASEHVPEDFVKVTVVYKTRAGVGERQERVESKLLSAAAASADVEAALCRLTFVDQLREIMKRLTLTKLEVLKGKEMPLGEAQTLIAELEAAISASSAAASDSTTALLEDVHGQVAEAVSKNEFYTKWGVHYLPSLMCAHLAQQCNNFKDPGVQQYGGDLFNDLRDKADEIFLALDPPTASTLPVQAPAAPAAARTSYSAPRVSQPAVSMASYYDRYGG
eukprot:TRINITY_DN82404_c0_g1_i1.p1 TRINITY_DN82404_c0_g1~~TRINITY_DN82404_c0_g1_i1.p1  ORF type:complete len:616 (-),score=115.62 TRINITY_DN82404_c0_g1_i1:279-2126(-)